ncbi:hypothetical protein IGI04_017674 [Brassica rapa subsp. trilocularis]|uniref:Uncharacterized protein n=1 Tax=Brassica rapa subsp. trilocularis TaxID=1813537 RepID=A0ABQ7MD55_BRACM|nr:hypothetical protein IGI04_017674 [Brassica rapa subsp. trilocularis]
MAATKMFLIKWYSSSTNLEVFQIWKTSGTTYLLVVWKSSGLLGSLLTKSSGLPGSRLDFQEVVWTFRKSSGLPGSRLDFQEVVWIFLSVLVFQIWKTSGTTYLLVVWKSSGLLGNLLTKSSGLPGSRLDFQEVVWTSRKSFLIIWYSSSTNLKVFQIWKTSGTTYLLVVWKSSGSLVWKSSELPKSLLAKSSELPGSRLDFLEVTTYNSVVHETTEMLQISKSIAKITSALTRRLPGKSSTARRPKGKSSTARRLPK